MAGMCCFETETDVLSQGLRGRVANNLHKAPGADKWLPESWEMWRSC